MTWKFCRQIIKIGKRMKNL